MVDVAWSDRAVEDLDAIIGYIDAHDPDAATRTWRDLVALAESLRDFPHRGRPAGNDFRELVTVPPYVLRYVVRNGHVTIVRVRHGRQRPLD